MANQRLNIPHKAEVCGKVRHYDGASAEGHRSALESWDRATGQERKGFRLVVYHCNRCSAFHVGHTRVAALGHAPH